MKLFARSARHPVFLAGAIPEHGHGLRRFLQVLRSLEVWNGTIAPASGFGLDHALTAWGNFWKNGYLVEGK